MSDKPSSESASTPLADVSQLPRNRIDPQDAPIAHHRESDGNNQTLEQHLLGVARLSRLYAKKMNLEEHGELIGLLHDLGKYSHEFQSYIKSAVGLLNQDEDEEYVDVAGLKGKIDHSTAGAQMIWQELSKQGQLGQIVGQILSLCIASHHSGLIDCLSSDTGSLGEDIYGRRMNKADERAHMKEALAKADDSILSRVKKLTGKLDIYVFYGSMNPQLAEKTKFSDEDANAIKEILPKLFENDESSARPAGSMEVIKVFWWKHNCKSGQHSSAKVHGSLTVKPNGSHELAKLDGLVPETIAGF